MQGRMRNVQVVSPIYVHPSALCESDQVGEGTRIWAFAHVMSGAAIGRQCNVGSHAFVESGACVGDGVVIKNGVTIWEGVVLEDYVFVGPGVVFTNDRYPRSRHAPEAGTRYQNKETWLEPTLVRRGASIGAGAQIMCGVTIGEYAMIGAGSLVTRDVPAYRLVAGSPARSIGWACACGQRLGEWLVCRACGRRFYLEGQVLMPEGNRGPARHAVA